MKFIRQHWYYFSAIAFVALTFIMGLVRPDFSEIQVILMYSFMAIFIHQFEEYILPGGFPATTNALVFGEREVYDRYPLNKQLSFFINVVIAYPFLISPIIFPDAIWLGLAQVFFCAGFEFLVHGIIYPIQQRKLYNPGLGTVVCLHIPICIHYVWYVESNGLATGWDYLFSIITVLVVVVIILTLMLPPLKIMNKESKYPFSEAEIARFGMDKKVPLHFEKRDAEAVARK